jgi:parallel beta-helix repeat protein
MISARSLALRIFPFALFLMPAFARAGNVGGHAPIVIQSDADFANCACVTSGDGSQANPFIIGPWAINNVSGDAVFIDGSNLTKSFVILNLTVAGNGAHTIHGIKLHNINGGGTQSIVAQVKGAQTSIQTAEIGILVESSSYVTLDGGGENPNGAGIIANGAGTINKNSIGAIDVENSNYVVVKGWQMSANGPSIQPDWVTLDPSVTLWAVGGVRFFGVTNSTVDHNAVNNCTDNSFSLFNSSYNTLSSNTANYPFTMNFMVADGSSYNTLSGNVASTGDFIGYLVADPLPGTSTLVTYGPSHDNTLIGNSTHADGPTGAEIHAGTVPAFAGGFVVLNGTYNNQILNNQEPGNTGGGFVWAQVVPSSSSPIGVVNYPPLLHCNVTVSEGGGGVENRNGNAWLGNVTQRIDPCLPTQ